MAGIARVLSTSSVEFDRWADGIPVLSFFTNAANLVQRVAVLPLMSEGYVSTSRYYTYLSQKSPSSCVLGALGVLPTLDGAVKRRFLMTIRSLITNGDDITLLKTTFDSFPITYQIDPNFVIDILRIVHLKSIPGYEIIIKSLPEELRNQAFVARILEQVIFESHRAKTPVKTIESEEFEEVSQLDAIEAGILGIIPSLPRVNDNPIAPDDFLEILSNACGRFLELQKK